MHISVTLKPMGFKLPLLNPGLITAPFSTCLGRFRAGNWATCLIHVIIYQESQAYSHLGLLPPFWAQGEFSFTRQHEL